MQIQDLDKIYTNQKSYFYSGATRDVNLRLRNLKRLKEMIIENEQLLLEALNKDLGKHPIEGFMTEVGFILSEITHTLKNLKSWSKSKSVWTPLHSWPGKSFVYYEPYGTVLIMAPWNYPFQLLICPLIGALAAGNTAILKPSPAANYTSSLITNLFDKTFPSDLIACFEGEKETNALLLKKQFDYLFYTGGPVFGKFVMQRAAEYLTPLTLELGGKSPCIVDKTADIDVAAKRIAWGKFINAGQTCVAPDHVWIHESRKEEFLQKIKTHLVSFYDSHPESSPNFGRIINNTHFQRLLGLLTTSGRIFHGGQYDEKQKYIAPTVLVDVKPTDPVMQEEIFGPILPVLTFQSLSDLFDNLNQQQQKTNNKPLAAYFFTKDKGAEKLFLQSFSFGGGCINDCLFHLGNPNLPFGGVGQSGIGKYHGKRSFETFSNEKSIYKNTWLFDLPLRYPPFTERLLKIYKWILR